MSQSEKVLFDNRIKRKNVLALNEKVAAIREFEKTPIYKHVGRSFHCSPDQIKRIIQQREEILKAWEQRTRRCNEVKSLEMKSVRVSMLGKSVYEWIRRMMYYKDFIITDGLIQKMALQFKSALGIQVFFPHQDWCDKFRRMYKIGENDTKKLNIAYTQGHSVQIKDIIRDILMPNPEDHAEDQQSCKSESGDAESDASDREVKSRRRRNEVDDDYSEDDDENDDEEKEREKQREEEVAKKYHLRPKRKSRIPKKKVAAVPPPSMPQRHLIAVKLPLVPAQVSGAKMPQQVLVATPITPGPKGRPTAPMTMTIIPLASVAQTLNSVKPQLPQDKPVVPPPMVEIKREVEDDEPAVTIKQELISEDEREEDDSGNANAPDVDEQEEKHPVDARVYLSPKKEVVEKMDTDVSEEEEDNLALAQLRKGLASKVQSNSNNSDSSARVPTPTPIAVAPNATPSVLPAMPPLTRAPTIVHSTSSNKRRLANFDRSPTLPPISSCAEARRYLKLLEDFALVKENFRLIGLITRADEVLRELDGDDDVDVV